MVKIINEGENPLVNIKIGNTEYGMKPTLGFISKFEAYLASKGCDDRSIYSYCINRLPKNESYFLLDISSEDLINVISIACEDAVVDDINKEVKDNYIECMAAITSFLNIIITPRYYRGDTGDTGKKKG